MAVELDSATGDFESARWRSHLVVPGHACIRCTGQYNSSDVLQELDGSLDDPSYIANLPPELRPRNQNVFPFSLGSASMQVNLMVRYLIADDWWPETSRQEYRFIAARTVASTTECQPHCSFRDRVARGDTCPPSYLQPAEPSHRRRVLCPRDSSPPVGNGRLRYRGSIQLTFQKKPLQNELNVSRRLDRRPQDDTRFRHE